MPSEKQIVRAIEEESKAVVKDLASARFWKARYEQSLESEYNKALEADQAAYESELEAIEAHYKTSKDQLLQESLSKQNQYKSELEEVENQYDETFKALLQSTEALSEALELSPWDDPRWATWEPKKQPAKHVGLTRVGTITTPGKWNRLTTPALVPIITGENLVFKASGKMKDIASRAASSVLLRLLVTVPPGKLQFVMFDPVGLGQNVAAFMSLADHHEELVGSRAWTEPHHIEERLTGITEHMETVIQKYLRNKFATMEAYNEEAGEVAEPYQIVVAINFPVNFSEQAARRLLSIATNGPRCGVYVVATVDMDQKLPYNFNLDDLERYATVIAWDGHRFVWNDEVFRICDLELENPPQHGAIDHLIELVGKTAKEASVVQVPFEMVAPQRRDWWTWSTQNGLTVPLG